MRKEDLASAPLPQFERWFSDACEAGISLPEAAGLATATPDGTPSLRMVLVKAFDERGFAFFTNLDSRKAAELGANPRAALLFHWKELDRQVRLEGPITAVNRNEVEIHARRRSRESQLSALASPQSRPVESREWLEQRVAALARDHPDGELPVPDRWGGFRLVPEAYEFWQSGTHRLHDRFRYLPAESGWTIERLGP
ncbi:MAG TPA: pyridoxamine 5'-phosphate oxidase [Thermoleophilaceae bacterium]|nr:pyridoxamine 5'-phosphate oxidase [Thermoleophilaceae bacterium]